MGGCDRAEALASGMRATGPFVTRFLAGFDDTNRTKQMPMLPNHAAWCMGHLALTMNRFAERFDGKGLPEISSRAMAGRAMRSVLIRSQSVSDRGRRMSRRYTRVWRDLSRSSRTRSCA